MVIYPLVICYIAIEHGHSQWVLPGTIEIAFFNWGIWRSTFGEACWKDLGLGQNSSDLGKHRWECLFSALYIYIIRSKWSGYPILTHTQMSKIQGLWHDDTLTWIVYWVSATKICSTNQTVEHLDFTKISEIWRVVMIMSQDWSSWLVVLPLNRKMKVSWDDEIPNMGKSIQIPWFQSPPTSPGIYSYFIQMASVLSVLNPVILNR